MNKSTKYYNNRSKQVKPKVITPTIIQTESTKSLYRGLTKNNEKKD